MLQQKVEKLDRESPSLWLTAQTELSMVLEWSTLECKL